jgi:hypothetical protein
MLPESNACDTAVALRRDTLCRPSAQGIGAFRGDATLATWLSRARHMKCIARQGASLLVAHLKSL